MFTKQEVRSLIEEIAQRLEAEAKRRRYDFRSGETDMSDGLESAAEIVREWEV